MSRLTSRFRLIPVVEGTHFVAEAPSLPLRRIFKRFWPDARPFRRWIPVLILLIAIGTAIEAAEIWLFGLVVDEVLEPRDLGPLLWIGIAYVAFTVVGGAISFAEDYLDTWLGERFLLNLRTRVFGHIQRLSLDVLDRRRLGDVMSRLTNDVEAIESFVLSGIVDAIAAVLTIVFFTAALFYLDWQLALISLAAAPLLILAARRFSGLLKRVSREERRRTGSLSAVAEESLANTALVQASNREASELDRFRRENEGIVQAELTSARIEGLFEPVMDLIELAAVLLIIGFGTVAVTDGRLTIGGLIVFLIYLAQLYEPVDDLTELVNELFTAAAGAERVAELLDEEPRVKDSPGAKPLGSARGVVELAGVSFTYPDARRRALSDVSLRAEPGQTVAIVGPSGAGKSTLAKLLLRFYDPDAGSVRLDGHDLREVQLASLRENVAILLQETLVLHGSARENIAFGRVNAGDEEIEAAARAAGVDRFIQSLPDGYDTDLGERGRRLSGGERQRIAIARALLADAPVLVLDEPSTGLDSDTRAALLDPLRLLMADRTTVVISHDLLTVREADLIVVLDEGGVVERGQHQELVAAGGLYARLWSLRATEGASPRDPAYSPEPAA
jgi:ABC-type multidrug transport system fused ATPase/permease subunit